MPVAMYNKEGKFEPVDNCLINAKLEEGYTLDDPAATNADTEARQAQHDEEVKSNEEMLADLLGNNEPDVTDTVSLDELVFDNEVESESEVED